MKLYSNNELLSLFERHIAQMPTPEEPQRLYAPIKYGLEVGGKRIRPTLLMLAYNLYAEDIERALMPAMAVEIFHNFTLLHDDIMDNAAVRRGRPSVPAKWGDNVAILSGDAMLIKAYIPEVKVTVDASCCAGVTPDSHKNALAAMKMCQINIENWEE